MLDNSPNTDDLQHWDTGNSVSSSNSHHWLVSWVSPPCGVVKVNFDAVWTNAEVSIDYIIRDYHGNVLFAASRKAKAPSVPLAELHVAWKSVTIVGPHVVLQGSGDQD